MSSMAQQLAVGLRRVEIQTLFIYTEIVFQNANNLNLFTLLFIFLTGQPAQWQNMAFANIQGLQRNKIGKNSVSVLVDHF